MSQVIAGIYELGKKIGAGGGGVVYLGTHLRLNKKVVLKADKRRLRTDPQALRREVDMLKNLRHTYIPQVYDFVQEDGVVYTVMDYIEGESLDKLLSRGEKPSQPQVIRWACQLLEALCYLHGCPPHGILHGDIKPANIMLRPDGSICLIDFNIALALREDGAVKVGFSRGYASPEHYGADYIRAGRLGAARPLGVPEEEKAEQDREQTDGRRAGREKEEKTEVEENSEKTETGEDSEETEAGESLEKTNTEQDAEKTELGTALARQMSGREKNLASTCSSNISTNSRKSGILLDVRSDLYSLGATLYHLLSGVRPAQDARQVKPLGPEDCSAAVSAILQKAMALEPEKRYQSAEEMLNAFRMLPRRDKRMVRHRRRMRRAAVSLTALFLAGGACAFIGLKQLEQRQTALTLAEYSADALNEGSVSRAVELALQAIPSGNSIWEAPVTAQARKALTDALGVYELSDGFRSLDRIELPSAPFGIAVSPKGTRFAVVYAYEAAVFDVEEQKKIAVLPLQASALADVQFVDEETVLYAGEQGVSAYDLNEQKELWKGETATNLTVSADGQVAAAVNRDDDHAVIYRIADGSRLAECFFDGRHLLVAANDIFSDPENNVFALNEDGRLLAVSFSDGSLMIYDWEHPGEELIVYEESDYRRFQGGFSGKYFAFSAKKGGEASFGLIDTAEAVYAGGYSSKEDILVQAGPEGIFAANGNLLVRLNTGEMKEEELAYTGEAAITGFAVGKDYVLAATDDNGISFYDNGAGLMSKESGSENGDFVAAAGDFALIGNRNEPSLRLMKRESHEEARLLSYDPRYAHEEARLSQDERTVMLFSYQGFRIYNMEGTLLAEVALPEAETIYDQQFIRKDERPEGEGQGNERREDAIREGENSWLEVTWYDGMVRCYSAADGALISEKKGEAPAKDLYEEFFVGGYRIASPLHETPQVFERDSGRWVAALEEDSYLTYVTKVDEYFITEYISAAGERYGLLLNEDWQKLAFLPGLCDIMGNRLIFDCGAGNLRQSCLYSLEELVRMGEEALRDKE